MTRALFRDVVLNPYGNGVSGASVEVRDPFTTTPVSSTLYDENGNVLANPLTTNTFGEFAFYMDDPQRVDLHVSKSTFTTETQQVDVLVPASAIEVTSFNGRTGDVVPTLADYDEFFLTQAEGDARYLQAVNMAGLAAWYKADVLELADGDPVVTWPDSSGYGRDMSQVTAGLRPTFQTDEVNGRSVVRFDGADDFLFRAESFLTGQVGTVFAVVRLATNAGTSTLFCTRNDDVSQYVAWLLSIDNGLSEVFVAGPTDVRSDSPAPVDTPYLAEISSDGAQTSFKRNGVSMGTMGTDSGRWFGDVVITNTLIGVFVDGQAFRGDVAELIIYDGVTLDPLQKDAVRRYLSAKYAIPVI